MNGRFEIYLSIKNRKLYFRLKTQSGQIVLGSGGYQTASDCQQAIKIIRRHCHLDACVECLTASNGHHYYNVKAPDERVIATSRMYAGSGTRDRSITQFRSLAPKADLVDLTLVG